MTNREQRPGSSRGSELPPTTGPGRMAGHRGREFARWLIGTRLRGAGAVCAAVAVVIAVAGCGGSSNNATAASSGKSASSATSSSSESSSSSEPSSSSGGWVIGVSNPVIGNGWRSQWENEIKAFASLPENKSYIKEVKIVNTPNNDPTQQAAGIRNLISEGVNALIIDAATPTGLNTVIAQAHNAGVKVVCADNPCTSPYADTVALNNFQFGELQAKWLVEALKGTGNIVMIRGVEGASADVQRYEGAMSVFHKASGIKILDTVPGEWTESVAQKAMAQLLSTYNNINGVWGEGGNGIGVVNAYVAAHRKFVPITGETTNGYLKDLAKYRSQGLSGVSVGGGMANGVWAVRQVLDQLRGTKTVPEHMLLPDTEVVSDSSHELVAGTNYFPNLPSIFWLGYNNTLASNVAFAPKELLSGKVTAGESPAPAPANSSFWSNPVASPAPH